MGHRSDMILTRGPTPLAEKAFWTIRTDQPGKTWVSIVTHKEMHLSSLHQMYKSLIQRQWARRSSLFDHLRNHWCRLKSKIDKLLAWLDPPGTGSERPSNQQFNRKYNYKKKNKRKLKTRIARVEITSMEEKIRLRWQH